MPMDQKRSSFAVTCNLLSQYLKEKKGGGCYLGSSFSLGMVPCSSSPAADGKGTPKSPRTLNLLPGLDISGQPKPSPSAQMTIFYAGKVIVIDNFPEEKAMRLVAIAGKASSVDAVTNTTTVDKPRAQPHLTMDASDLPIARRVSLGRFLEKRKDSRVSSKAPYQVNPSPSSMGGLAIWETTTKKAPK